uniref:Putative glycerophosphoryl diester phosphodiesterase yhdW n=1 Tax=Lygus hesperus TaxID=30085 RepID=A0A0A9Y3Z8_LYGHE
MIVIYYYLLPILSCIILLYCLYRKYKIKAYVPKGRNFESLLVGHRGSRGFPDIPENSLISFKYSIERGAQAIELDCRLTKDGHVVVIHDDNVKRLTTSETGSISEMTLDDVKKLSYRDCTDTCVRIPTLHEVMSLVKSYNVKLFIEIKCIDIGSAASIAKKVCDLVAEYDAYSWACIIAFNPLV